jgi:hypothetical protein
MAERLRLSKVSCVFVAEHHGALRKLFDLSCIRGLDWRARIHSVEGSLHVERTYPTRYPVGSQIFGYQGIL